MLHTSGRNIAKLCVSPDTSIWEALKVIDLGGCKTVFIVDKNKKFLGLVADPDIRRALLDGQNFDAPVRAIMNNRPLTLKVGVSEADARGFIRRHKRDAIPLLNDNGQLVDILTLVASIDPPALDHEVVLMAGGMGKRLLPLTDTVPKPLVEVGSKPMLEILVEYLASQGFRNITLSLNYMGDMIEQFFGNGENWDVNIRYVKEDKPLGTAGALALLKTDSELPVIAMNCDVLTKMDFQSLIKQHSLSDCVSTICVSQQSVEVPYGVVEHEELILQNIVEKPVWNYFVNAGVYVFSRSALTLIKPGETLDMPDFIHRIKEKLGKVSVFPIHEYWLDVGTHSNLRQAEQEFHLHFGTS